VVASPARRMPVQLVVPGTGQASGGPATVPTLPLFATGAIREMVARVGDPGYRAWESQVARSGACVRPVRLRGSAQAVHLGTGEVLGSFSTMGGPVGVLLVACGDRRSAVCPPCAETYRADTWHVVAAGLRGPDLTGNGPRSAASAVLPSTVGDHPSVFATLTAPGFGAVHTVLGDGSCRPRREMPVCEHGRAMWCHTRHEEGDVRLGTALCGDCYDYVGHILWHTGVSELWRRFTIALPRALARLRKVRDGVHLRAADVRKEVRVSYVKVAEWQRRAAVHLHAVIRLDGVDSDDPEAVVAPPGWADVRMLEAAVREAAEAVWVDLPSLGGEDRIARWGSQVDVQPITSPRTMAAYLAKYATKTASDTVPGLPVRRYNDVDLERLRRRGASEHVVRLAGTCLRLALEPECVELRLEEKVHVLGFGGHFATKSRRFSTTLKALRKVRRDWRAGQSDGDVWRHAGPEVTVVGDWRLVGVGHATAGDALLAEQMARDDATLKAAVKDHDVTRMRGFEAHHEVNGDDT
jgi:hypothetical protein